ncbi:unnamed protein product [Arctogadus glacialis]
MSSQTSDVKSGFFISCSSEQKQPSESDSHVSSPPNRDEGGEGYTLKTIDSKREKYPVREGVERMDSVAASLRDRALQLGDQGP